MSGFDTIVHLVYLACAVCFVIGLHQMNAPATARQGNRISAAGMTVAILTTAIVLVHNRSVSTGAVAALVLGAIIVTGTTDSNAALAVGLVAIVLAAVNMVGGFVVTDRMLQMFVRKKPAPKAVEAPGGDR